MVSEIGSLAVLCLDVMHTRIPDKNIWWIFVEKEPESESSGSDLEDWHFSESESADSDVEGDKEFPD